MIIESSEETIMMKEGCLTYPFLFLNIIRPRKITLKYTDEDGELKEAKLDGMMSRIVQHEYDHMLGRNFTERASKLKIDAAMKKRDKMLKRIKKYQEAEAKMNKA
jgi:peptide deformylase